MADTGGNPAAAFRGAVAAVAEQVRGSGASVFAIGPRERSLEDIYRRVAGFRSSLAEAA